jgi:hypothetical protein
MKEASIKWDVFLNILPLSLVGRADLVALVAGLGIGRRCPDERVCSASEKALNDRIEHLTAEKIGSLFM